ncbi:MAG TPA: hypothetical protein VF587_16370 [Solirubrobacteraceae bacterium]
MIKLTEHKERRPSRGEARPSVRPRNPRLWIAPVLLAAVLCVALVAIPAWQSGDGGRTDVVLSDLHLDMQHEASCSAVRMTATAHMRLTGAADARRVGYRIDVESLDARGEVLASSSTVTGTAAASDARVLITETIALPRRLGTHTRARISIGESPQIVAEIERPVPLKCRRAPR